MNGGSYGMPASSSGFYTWRKRKPSTRSEADEALRAEIVQVREET